MPQPSHLSLKRDQQGRIAERTIRFGNVAETRRYAYDPAGRLSRVTDATGALSESYQYDPQGRRLAEINPARFRGERRYTYLSGNRLGQAGQTQYGHDRAGFRNLKVAGDAETHYRYEPSGLLMHVDLPNGRKVQYLYDANGLRLEKRVTVNGVGRLAEAFRWLDPLRLEEFHDGRQWWLFAYLEGRTPVGLTNGQDMYFILADQLGTPVALATTDGHIVQTMQYDSFGTLLQVRGDVVRLPLGFAGGLFDADTGLTRFVWRDYDADTGRFTALDPLGKKGGDNDWYGYCVDDPVNRVDVWGLSAIPMPFPILVPPVAVPGTPENNNFTKGTLDILNGIGDFFGGMFGGDDEAPVDPNTYETEHSNNARPSTRNDHENGQARKQRDQGLEKKEINGRYKRNPNKRRNQQQSEYGIPDDFGIADIGTSEDDEEAA